MLLIFSYTAQMIATITRHQVGTVERALQIFQKLKLVEPLKTERFTYLTLQELQNPEDTAHSRIYDRVLEMCVPVHFSGDSYRKEQAQARIEKFRERLQ